MNRPGGRVFGPLARLGDRAALPLEGILDALPDAVVAVNEHGSIVLCNDQTEEMFGYGRGELQGAPVEILVPVELRELHQKHRKEFLENPATRPMAAGTDLIGRRKDGSSFAIEVSLKPVTTDQGVIVVAAVRDVTEQHRLVHGQRAIAELAADMAFVFRIRPDLTLEPEWTTASFERITGYRPDEWVEAGGWSAHVHPDDRERVDRELDNILRGTSAFLDDFRIVRPDGDLRWIRAWGRPLADASGGTPRVAGAAQDITDQKLAEERWNVLSRLTADVTFAFEVDETGEPRLEWVTEGLEDLIGYSLPELLAAGGWEAVIHPDDLGRYVDLFSTPDTGSEQPEPGEFRVVARGGEERWLRLYAIWAPSALDERLRLYGAAQDVTERRRAEEAQAASSRLLREAQTVAHLGSWTIDPASGRIRCSEEHLRIMGMPLDAGEVTADDLVDLIHPDDRDAFVTATLTAIEENTGNVNECRLVRPDGEERWIQSRCSAVRDTSGKLVEIHGVTQDITERKQTELKIATHEEQLREAQAVAHLGSWTWTIGDELSVWSDEMFRIHGLDLGSTPTTLIAYMDLVHPDDRERALSELGWTLHGRRPYDLEYRVIRPDGQERWVHARGRPVLDSDGVVTAVNGTILDVTERKQTELALAESEARLREAQAIGHVGSWEWHLEEDSALFSEETCRIFGIPSEDAPDGLAAFLEYVHPDDRAGVVETMSRVSETGEEFEGDFRVVRPDHEVRWLFARGRARRGRRGKPVALLGTLQDITQRHEEEERYRAISELITDAAYAFRVDDSGVAEPEWITAAFARLAGYPDDDALGLLQRWRDLVHPDDHDTMVRSIKNAVEGNEDVCEYRLITRTGDTRWIQAYGRPIIDDITGKVTRIYGAARDITEQRQVEAALREAYERERDAAERLRSADRLKDEFLSTASHELRTPLTSIVGFASALSRLRERLDPKTRDELVQKLERNALELGSMVERLLDFSRLQAGTVELDIQPLRLLPIVEQCLDSHVPAALSAHQVEIEVDGDLEAQGDPAGIIHVLSNLLTNAAKYSPEGSRITVRARAEPENVVVSVADEGVGIDPTLQNRIFERFFRGSEQPPGIRGSGIGLAIVRSYVELMGGRIWIESEPGSGATFSFSLPVDDRAPII